MVHAEETKQQELVSCYHDTSNKILVGGGTGFIGTELCKTLKHKGKGNFENQIFYILSKTGIRIQDCGITRYFCPLHLVHFFRFILEFRLLHEFANLF